MGRRPVDLHLLAVFDALMAERSVTRAALRVNLGQSATSKALARLRELFDDPLFLRSGTGVVPTPRAHELAPQIRDALAAVRHLLSPQGPFDPTTTATEFGIATSDYIAFALLPVLQPALARAAPGVRLVVQPLDRATPEDLLLSGRVDLAIASVARVARPLQRQELFRDVYVCVSGRRRGRGPIDADAFVAAPHLVIPRQNGGASALIDDALAQLGASRRIALTVPDYLSLPPLLEAGELVATVPRRVGDHLAARYRLRCDPHPLPLAPFVVSQIWHQRASASPAHTWLRAAIAAAARTV